jgi:DNA-binding XRE family transcriptional regulator
MTPATLKRLRRTLQLSQAQFGAQIGVTKTSIYMWESGRTPIPHWLKFAVATISHPKAGTAVRHGG